MANSTSASLKLTVQATGENAGTWGQITNTNLLILEQAIGGFDSFNVTNASRALTFTNGATFKTSSGSGVLLCEGHTYTLYSDGTNVVKASELKKWRAISAAETVQPGAQIAVNTNGGAVTITLPASPSIGDEVAFIDQGYDFNTNALTVGRNSSNIANAAADLVVNTQGAGFCLVFSGDATTGWTYKEK